MNEKYALLVFLFLMAVATARAEEFTGRCVGVSDGDTLSVMHAGRAERIRLYGIDTPELHQAFGAAAKKYTAGQATGKTLKVQVKDKDRYGRTVGWVILPGGESLNATIVRAGMAWHYTQYSKDPQLAARLAENERLARREKKGLWSAPNPAPPWEFRRTEAGAAAAAAPAGKKQPGAPEKPPSPSRPATTPPPKKGVPGARN